MFDYNMKRCSSEEQCELPLYIQPTNPHISAYPIRLTSRSTSVSPTVAHSHCLPTSITSPPRPYEQTSNSLRESMNAHSGANDAQVEETPSNWKVSGAIIFYIVAAIVMVFANKWVLRVTAIPISFLLCQLLLAAAFLKLAGLSGLLHLPSLSLETGKALLPLILINVIGLIFNTYCLHYVDASFYQVARGLVLPFTVLTSQIFLNSRPSPHILSVVLVVCAGFLWGVQSDNLYTSRTGVILGVLSSLTTSVHAIIVKTSLSVTNSPIELAYYNNLFSAVFLLPLLGFTSEISSLRSLVEKGGNDLQTFIIGAFITGVFGCLISLAGLISIKITSPVTHMITSAVRGVLQTILGAILFNDVITVDRCIGIGLILGGSMAYSAIKDTENRPEQIRLKQDFISSHNKFMKSTSAKNSKNLSIKLMC